MGSTLCRSGLFCWAFLNDLLAYLVDKHSPSCLLMVCVSMLQPAPGLTDLWVIIPFTPKLVSN